MSMAGDAVRTGPPVLVSAYAASPAQQRWDPALEGDLLPALFALPDVVGFEVPWIDGIHPHDTDWFLANVPAGARLAITPLPWVMGRVASAAGYGIASSDAGGRRAALDDLERVRADAARITSSSAASVDLVALHTAPRGGGDVDALRRSLDEIAGWDWSGAALVIEHCDAWVPGQAPEKGFLALDAEIDALTRSGVPVGLWMNWGRSAIELRDADAVTAQISDAAASGLLTGLAFSGAAPVDGPYGAAWIDAHLPIAETHPASASLLDAAHVRSGLDAAGDVPWLGVKVSRRPDDATAAEVTRTVAHNLEVVRAAL